MRISVGAIMRNSAGHVLIFNHKKLGVYTIPSGKAENGETADEALRREVFEETGATVEFAGPIEEWDAYDYSAYLYLVSYTGEVINKEPEKHTEMLWVKPEELCNLAPKSDYLKRFLEAVVIV